MGVAFDQAEGASLAWSMGRLCALEGGGLQRLCLCRGLLITSPLHLLLRPDPLGPTGGENPLLTGG
jgi:hypothetical protein